MKFALIGKDISHSRSPKVYKELLQKSVDYTFLDYPLESEIPALDSLLKTYPRISVTAPYKEHCFHECEMTSEGARSLRAVNALVLHQGKILGTNTDLEAFKDIYQNRYSKAKKVILLGDGAMARVVKAGLPAKIHLINLSRKLGNITSINERALELDSEDLVINACAREFKLNFLSDKSLNIWDFNYGMPEHKAFAERFGHRYQDGYELLIRQAQYALSFWNSYIS